MHEEVGGSKNVRENGTSEGIGLPDHKRMVFLCHSLSSAKGTPLEPRK